MNMFSYVIFSNHNYLDTHNKQNNLELQGNNLRSLSCNIN
jgi:hypothetical protein